MDNNNVQAGLANINAKAEVNTEIKGELKAADNIHNQLGGTYNDNRTIIVQGVTRGEMDVCINTKIQEKIELFKNELETELIPAQLQKLKNDIGVITSYKETISISAIKNDADFDKMLSSVLKDRIESDDTDTQNTCAQAISHMKNLTKNHLKIIAFLYLFQSNYVKNNTNTSTFIEFYNKYISNLIDFSNDKLQELGITVISNGLAVAFTLGWEINSFLPNNFYDALTGNIININPTLTSIINHLNFTWKQIGTSSARLTAVGKCIARTYLHDILELDVIDTNDTQQVEVPTREDIVTHDDLGEIFESAKITPYENILTYEEIKEDK